MRLAGQAAWPNRLIGFGVGAIAVTALHAALDRPAGDTAQGTVGMVADPCDAAQAPVATRRYMTYSGHCRYRDDNRRLIASGQRPPVVAIGDSITEFWGDAEPDLFGGEIVNRGVAGQTSQQMLLRFEQDVVALRPRLVHILAGTNDLVAPTGGTSPEIYKSNMRAMFDLADRHGIGVIVGTIPPPVDRLLPPAARSRRWIGDLNDWIKRTAQARSYVVADYSRALTGPDGSLRPGVYEDAVHPTPATYALLAPVLRGAVARAQRRSESVPRADAERAPRSPR